MLQTKETYGSLVYSVLVMIGKPLTKNLIEQGHEVTVISSSPEGQSAIEALGARAAIGELEDAHFVTTTFAGADVVYCLVPPAAYFAQDRDVTGYYEKIGNHYAQAIQQAGIQRVVHLSSIGAHRASGTGLLIGHHAVEEMFQSLPNDISIKHLRAAAFYNNLYNFIPVIKKTGFIAANYGGTDTTPWVSPRDMPRLRHTLW